MSLKSLKMACVAHKLEHHTIQAHKFGKVKNMEENVIYGQLDAYYMKCVLFIHHSELKIFQDSTVKLLLETMNLSHKNIHINLAI